MPPLAAAAPSLAPDTEPTTASTPSQHVREEKKAAQWSSGRQWQVRWCCGRTGATKTTTRRHVCRHPGRHRCRWLAHPEGHRGRLGRPCRHASG
jgi:hypothetical protein